MRLWKLLKPPRRFPPTREGWWFLAATLMVGAAAMNSGLNLLFLVFGMMLFLILASGVLSELGLRNLEVTRKVPKAVFAGRPFLVLLSVKNAKKRIPTYSLEVEDVADGRPVERRCFFLKLPGGRKQEAAYRHRLAKRGVHHLNAFRLATRFPFGLIRKSRDIEAPLELLVFPAVRQISKKRLAQTMGSPVVGPGASRPSRAGEFAGLRAYQPGDDPRDIHWRASARQGRMLAREWEEEAGQRVLIWLRTPDVKPNDDLWEDTISEAASYATAFLEQGIATGLKSPRGNISTGLGAKQKNRILRELALLPKARQMPPGTSENPNQDASPRPEPDLAVLQFRCDGSQIEAAIRTGPQKRIQPGPRTGQRTGQRTEADGWREVNGL